MKLCLTFLPTGGVPLDVRGLLPETLIGLTSRELAAVRLPQGRGSLALGEVCRIRTRAGEAPQLIFEGATGRLAHAGAGMRTGCLVIEGDAGQAAGAGMLGGELEIRGSAGDCLGLGLAGGRIRLGGSAADWCGAAAPGQRAGMTGGAILVEGSVGQQAGAGMRRGVIFVRGNAAEYAGSQMLAGTLLVAGQAAAGAGMGMRRGSLVAGRLEQRLEGFTFAGQADVEWLQICYRMLEQCGLVLPKAWRRSRPWRFSGDHLELGKGELIVHDLAE